MQLHLDPLGGVAGDMFIASLLDAFPELEPGLIASLDAAGLTGRAEARSARHCDAVLQGRRFLVTEIGGDAHHHHAGDEHGGHNHVRWSSIHSALDKSALPSAVRLHAIAIFQLLAEAEGRVHGVFPADVTFHEIGAVDSIADIVGAAFLIDALDASSWTVGAIPLGSGRIHTAHGLMPAPAPATALLLEGFEMIQDGVPGERVTPTGAAILRHLCNPAAKSPQGTRRLSRSGIGFGTRRLEGVSNCLRVLVFDEISSASSPPAPHREIAVLEFEVDDQTAEDLALGLDRLREEAGVFDVVQMPVFGKKGRMMTHVRLLAAPEALNDVTEACFRETTTIGLRHRIVSGTALPRRSREVEINETRIRVKTVDRPGGPTAKAEAEDVRPLAGYDARRRLRESAQVAALSEPAELLGDLAP